MEDRGEKVPTASAALPGRGPFTSLTTYQEDTLGFPNSPPENRWLPSAPINSFSREHKAQGESFPSFRVSCVCPPKACPVPRRVNL